MKGWEMTSADEDLEPHVGFEDPAATLQGRSNREVAGLLMRYVWTRYPLFGPAAALIGEAVDRLNNSGSHDLRDPSPGELEAVLHRVRSGPDAKPWGQVPPEAQSWYRALVEAVARALLARRRQQGVSRSPLRVVTPTP